MQLPAGFFLEAWYRRVRARRSLSPSEIAATPFDRTWHPYGARPGHPPPGSSNLLRRPSVQRYKDGAGILTCSPSSTPFGLDLGSGLPWEDEPGPGNLGFTARGFLTPFIATHFGISTSNRSTCPCGHASQQLGRSPTTVHGSIRARSEASVPVLSPVTFSARPVLTSELLRFL